MKLHIEKELNAPANVVWDILGNQYAQIGEWFSVVNYSRASKPEDIPPEYTPLPHAPVAGRYTESAVVKANEILTMYSDENREFIFDAVDVPKFMLSLSRNHTRVKPIGNDRSLVTIDVEMRLKHLFNLISPILRSRMTRMFTQLLTELEQHAQKQAKLT